MKSTFNKTELKKYLKQEAKALDIPSGSADVFIDRTIKAVEKSLKNKKLITKADLTRAVYKEIKQYHPDLAYVIKNRENII